MIPKQIAFFWTGRMSWLRWLTLSTFVKLNPDWKVLLYTTDQKFVIRKHWDASVDDDNAYVGQNYWSHIPRSIEVRTFIPPRPMCAAQICDIFQWKFLLEEGGFYADMDILWIKSFDKLFNQYKTCDAVFCLEKHLLAIGLVGSIPECPIFKLIHDSAVPVDNKDYQYYGTNLVYRLLNITASKCVSPGIRVLSLFAKQYPKLRIDHMPTETVYKFIWDEPEKIFEQQHSVPDNTIGIHWFGGGPVSNKWNLRLTESNWGQYNNTFTNCLRSILIDKDNFIIPAPTVAPSAST